MSMKKIKLIVAADVNGGIGYKNKLLFDDKVEMKHFRQTTLDNAVLMGRKTWDSIPNAFKPLAGRENYVVSMTIPEQTSEKLVIRNSINSALEYFKNESKLDTLYVMGGSTIYDYFLNNDLVDEIILTVFSKAAKNVDSYINQSIIERNFDNSKLIKSHETFNVYQYTK